MARSSDIMDKYTGTTEDTVGVCRRVSDDHIADLTSILILLGCWMNPSKALMPPWSKMGGMADSVLFKASTGETFVDVHLFKRLIKYDKPGEVSGT